MPRLSRQKALLVGTQPQTLLYVDAGGGFAIGQIVGYGLNAGYIVSPALSVEGSYLTGKKALASSDDGTIATKDFTVAGSLAMVRARYFFSK